MEARADIMTDYQMRYITNMIITIVKDTLKESDEKNELLAKLKAIRDGEIDKPEN